MSVYTGYLLFMKFEMHGEEGLPLSAPHILNKVCKFIT